MAPNPPSEEPCEVCKVPCKTFCATCKKAYYCCVDHQKRDRKEHKRECFPAKLATNLKFGGRCFIASRRIQAGELIFKDKALVSGPSGAEIYFHLICLSCYRSVKGGYKCSSCGWPMCSESCEKMPQHANNECKVFKSARVEPCVLKPYQYDFINFLRCLLLREHGTNELDETTDTETKKQFKESWDSILALESHSASRAESPFAMKILREAIQFIHKTCKLEKTFEEKLIDHVVGVWGINSFGANPPAGVKPGYARMATLLFPKLCLAAHNCIPNTHGVLREDIRNGRPLYTMELIASLEIPEGAQIHTTYANVCEGTVERREILQDHYYFSCSCKRCSSPTEFGTFFSALKCSSCDKGYLVSENPLDNQAAWVCTEYCPGSRKDLRYREFTQKINRIRREINAAEMEYAVEDCIGKYEEILESYRGVLLHPNHWLVIDIEFKLMLRLASYLNRGKKEQEWEGRARRLIELAEHCLEIADVLQPGLNSYRGKILFCLVEGKLKQLIRRTQSQGINEGLLEMEQLKGIKEKAEEAIRIMVREQGCEEKQVTVMLMQSVKTLDQMIEMARSSSSSSGSSSKTKMMITGQQHGLSSKKQVVGKDGINKHKASE